ncbi:MAG: FmdB family zinc ribbon protein [Steroidobacteraceae bacterium]
MPFYEYECSNCKYYSEVMQKITDPPLRKCPSCGRNTLKKLVSAPNFRLKGGGWYETDFKSDKEAKRNLAQAEKSEAAEGKESKEAKEAKPAEAGSKTESKPAAAASESKAAPPSRGARTSIGRTRSKTVAPQRASKAKSTRAAAPKARSARKARR